jgi:hypothetical protein
MVRAQNKERKELLKRNGWDHEQVNRRNSLRVIADEGLPGLQRSIPPRHHVDRNCRLGDLDAELEQLAVHLGGTPQPVLKAHSSDQIAQLSGDPRTAARRPGLPPPVSGKALAMPTHHGLQPDNGDGVQDRRAAPIEPDDQGPVDPTQTHLAVRRTLLQDVQLMTQHQDFSFQLPPGLKPFAQRAEQQEADCDHPLIMFRFAPARESNGWSFRKRQGWFCRVAAGRFGRSFLDLLDYKLMKRRPPGRSDRESSAAL